MPQHKEHCDKKVLKATVQEWGWGCHKRQAPDRDVCHKYVCGCRPAPASQPSFAQIVINSSEAIKVACYYV